MLTDEERQQRRDGWGIYRYRPMFPTANRPGVNNQLAFHKSQAKIRVIVGPNRAGKTTPAVAEVAALLLNEDYPDWWGWNHTATPHTPLTIWLSSPRLPDSVLADARLKRLFEGFWLTDPYTGDRTFTPPMVPKSHLKDPGCLERANVRSIVTNTGDVIVTKSARQTPEASAGEEPDLVLVDEWTDPLIWYEYVARVAQRRDARIIQVLTDTAENNQTDYLDFLRGQDPSLVEFFRFTEDNVHIDTEHHGEVLGLLPPEQQRIRRGGETMGEVRRCYPFANRWHKDFDLKKPEIKNPWGGRGNWIPKEKCFPIPSHWTNYLVFDPGITNPGASHVISAEPGTNNLFVNRGLHIEHPSADLMVDVRLVFGMAGNMRLRAALIDPKAVRHPMQFVGYAPKERLKIDLYNKAASRILGRPFRFAMAPSSVEMMKRETRISYLTAYLSPTNNTVPMMWLFDDGSEGQEALKAELDKYHWGAAPKGRTNNPNRPVPKHDHHCYCLEVAAIMGFSWWADEGDEFSLIPKPRDPFDPGRTLGKFMEDGLPEGHGQTEFM